MPPKTPRKKAKAKPRARAGGKSQQPVVVSRPRTITCFRRRHEEDAHAKPSISEVGYQDPKDKHSGIESEEEGYIQTNLYLYLRLPPSLTPNVTALTSPSPLPLSPPTPTASTFHDETTPFLMPLRHTSSSHPLDKHAIFPPGVPLSASELLAFYPQHCTWPDASHRLSRNRFSAEDVRVLGGLFRDGAPYVLGGWEASIPEKGKKGVKDLSTSHWTNPLGGQGSVPSFEQLVEGVRRMPVGIGRRHLSSVLEWYVGVRDSFTPRLELNVLHTRALVQAMRFPLRRYGPQNVDAAVLSSYRRGGGDAISGPIPMPLSPSLSLPSSLPSLHTGDKKREKSKITLNVPRQTVEVEVSLRVGSVLLMPYFGVGGLFCAALEWGVGRAEGRRRGRLEREGGGGGSKADGEVVRGYVGAGKRARDEDEGQKEREERVRGKPRGGAIG